MKWTLENDEEGLSGEPCEQWLVRDEETDNRDVVAVIPKTGDEEYDDEVTYRNAKLIKAAPDLLEALKQLVADDHPLADYNQQLNARQIAREAIAKATK